MQATHSKSFYLFFILALTLSSCIKDDVLIEDYCWPLSVPDFSTADMSFYNSYPQYSFACFNPLDPTEMIYRLKDGVGTFLMYKNTETNEEHVIYEGRLDFSPDWSIQGWIVLCLSDGNLWKIRPDGSDLTQITTDGCYFGCRWSDDGSQLLTRGSFCAESKSYIFSDSGSLVRALDNLNFSDGAAWKAGRFAGVDQGGLYIVDTNLDSIVFHDPLTLGFDGDPYWLDDNHIVWTKRNVINIYDLQSRTNRSFRSECESKILMRPSYHEGSNTVLYTLMSTRQIGVNARENHVFILKTNPENTWQEIIDF